MILVRIVLIRCRARCRGHARANATESTARPHIRNLFSLCLSASQHSNFSKAADQHDERNASKPIWLSRMFVRSTREPWPFSNRHVHRHYRARNVRSNSRTRFVYFSVVNSNRRQKLRGIETNTEGVRSRTCDMMEDRCSKRASMNPVRCRFEGDAGLLFGPADATTDSTFSRDGSSLPQVRAPAAGPRRHSS